MRKDIRDEQARRRPAQGRRNTLQWLGLGLAAGALGWAGGAAAQANWPTQPVKLIVPFGPGTATDTVARFVAQRLQDRMGHTVVVENRAGASGNIGAEAAARSPKDGHTLLFTVNSIVTMNPYIYKSLPFDPARDFSPISLVASVPYVLVANKDAPYNSLRELVAAAKARPGTIDYGTLGVGTSPHIIMELMGTMLGIRLVHIPYKSDVLVPVMSGQVPLTLQPTTTAIPRVKRGEFKALGVTSTKRLPALPDVPSISEVVPGYAGDGWLGIQAPAGTPQPAIDRLNREIAAVLATAETAERFASLGIQPWPTSPQQMHEVIRSDSIKWGKVIREAGIKPD